MMFKPLKIDYTATKAPTKWSTKVLLGGNINFDEVGDPPRTEHKLVMLSCIKINGEASRQ